MNIRERVTSQEVLAVSLALIMLMSVAGMAFIGGAGAQQATGGTYDQVFSESEDVSNELNVDIGSVELVGPGAAGAASGGVQVASDGQIEISGTSTENEFQGITLSTERIAAASGVSAPADDSLADFLDDDVPAEYNVSTNKSAGDAIPAVFIEFDPQSDFSQINKTERVRGNHDYIVVAPANASSGTLGDDDQLNGTVDTNLNASINNNISEGDIVALSVENTDSSGASSSLLANASDFGTVFDDLVGDSESDLQNDNIDQVQFAAGTFDGTSVSIQEVQLNDDIGANVADGETIHHNKIVLDDGSSTTSFSSISAAVNASNGDNTITVDRGEYGALEGQNVTVDTNDTIQTTDRVNDGDTLDRVDVENTSIDDRANETIITTSLQVDDNATVENVVVENDSSAVVNVSSSNAALDSVIVNSTLSSGDGVNATVSGVTLTNSTIVSNDATLFEGGVGLELNDADGSNVSSNYFVGFETQVANSTAVDALFDAHASEFDDPAAQSAVPFNGGSVVGDSIFGSISLADAAASDTDVINVSDGTYFDDSTLEIATDDIEVIGDTEAVIDDDVELNSSTAATLENFEVNGSVTGLADSGANAGAAVTVDTVNVTASNITINEADDVTIQDATIPDAGVDAIDINSSLSGSLVVERVSVGNLTGGVALNATDVGQDVTITDVDVTGNTTASADGFNLGGIGEGDENGIVNVSNNELTGLGDGTALRLNETAGGSADEVVVDGNTFSAENGSQFTGIQYILDDTTGANITDNTIIGADVTGGADSVGLNLKNVTVSAAELGEGVTDPDGEITVEALTVRNNVISGHARVVNSEDTEVISGDYDNFVDNNEFGTLVYAPAGSTYEDTYGLKNSTYDELGLTGQTDSYLPGGVVSAVKLVNSSADTGFAAFRNQSDAEYTPEIQVYSTDNVAVAAAPENYTEPSEVVVPDIRSLTVTGEDQPVVESRFVINSSDQINNHTIQDLAINSSSGEPAINVTDGHNSQSTFENLDVTSDDDGLVVNADGTDVNVIEVRDSDFDVAADGIVLADGADDRDGFVIENNTITGDGIDATGTGLNLTEVEKPGKAGLETSLTVTENYVTDFQVQVAGSTGTAGDNITALNFTSAQFGGAFDANGAITIDNNEFGQQVLVFEADAEPQNSNDENVSLNATDVFGSIQAAHDAASGDDDVIRVYDVTSAGVNFSTPSGTSTTYAEPLNITKNNVTVRGPAYDESADAAFRTDEALISDTVELSGVGTGTDASATFTGFSVVAEDSNDEVVNVTNGAGNLTVANTAVSAFGNETTGLPDQEVNGLNISGTNGNSEIFVESVFIGDHDEANTTNSSIVVDASSTLEIANSTLTSDVETADGTGVEYTAAAGNTTISNTTISNHAEAGVDAAGNSVNITVTDSTVIENNDAEGLNATVTDGDTVIVENSEVANNNVTGVVADGNVTLTVNSTAVSGHDTGLDVENATADSSIIRSTVDANDVGLAVNASDVDPEITGNTFTNDDIDINTTDDDDAKLNASLNYFGTDFGPESDDAAGVGSDVVYDPFLSEDQTDSTVSETENTTSFAHDVIVPAGETASLGIPGNINALALDDVIEGNPDGAIYGFENGEFTRVDPSTTSVNAFDAFVIENDGDSAITASIEYSANTPASDGLATRDLDSGFNFVAAPVAGQTNATFYEAAEASQQNDFILEPFGTGNNLYGTGGQTAADFANPDEGFRSSFGAGDAAGKELHPHVGYLVFVQDQSPGVTVIEQIGPGVTADEVEDRTNQTAS